MTPMPAPLNRLKRAAGFTLTEVLCAIGIGAITITALFSAFNAGFSILTITREDQRATQILLQKTEAFRLFTWAQLSNCPTAFQEYYYPAGVTSSNAGTIYYGTINAIGDPTNIPTSTTYRTNVHLITVSVSWTNLFTGKNKGHTRTMQTMNAFNGMQTYLKGKS